MQREFPGLFRGFQNVWGSKMRQNAAKHKFLIIYPSAVCEENSKLRKDAKQLKIRVSGVRFPLSPPICAPGAYCPA